MSGQGHGQVAFATGGIFGIYLAAGSSRRMGCPKLSLPVAGTTLGSLALQAALLSEMDGVLVVIRPDDPLDWVEVHGKWQPVLCPDASQGQASSLRCGIQTAQQLQARAVVVLLADQPFVTTEMINRLLQTFCASERAHTALDYVASSHHGLQHPPILFSHTLFPRLLTLQGDAGARHLLRKHTNHPLHGATLEFADARLFLDVDTPEAYAKLTKYPS